MKRYPIRLTNIEEATAFVKTVSKFECDMDICRGSIIIDAKSFLGIMTICSDTDLELIIYNNHHDEVLESISEFLVDQKTA
ncbi:HPr family phosphocarrier protein [Clostridium boliviensis]|uniref:HPr family phosphocarrier protein n=1 Tax=Clostridium boliviensis TaxID=318465 RepID=A0ABU4GJF7_9CLOT|nr:HPr family phosphocarrier protein [Clostridium boliviensis]MDW2797750.1 HPr family phosphocarrier protein [Clostridium boliviensis]